MRIDDLDEAKVYQTIQLGARDAVLDVLKKIDPDFLLEAVRNGTSDAAADGLFGSKGVNK